MRVLTTFNDIVEHLMDFMGSVGDTNDMAQARRAAAYGLREIQLVHNWRIYQGMGRVTTQASYGTGTIAYAQSTRTVTLTGGTFPSWANLGTILIDSVFYPVDSATGTTVVLNSQQNPGADIASGTAYSLYQQTYPLPNDFYKMTGDVMDALSKWILRPITADRAYFMLHWRLSPGQPFFYTIIGDPSYQDQLAIMFSSPPVTARSYDFAYQRRPRSVRTMALPLAPDRSTVTVSGTSVTGAGTAFTCNHVGAILRVSANSSPPTGIFGSNPFAEERVITAVSSATAATIDQAFTNSYTNAPYLVSDPIDIDSSCMTNAYLRCAELQLATMRRSAAADRQAIYAAYMKDLEQALSADTKTGGPRVAGPMSSLDLAQRLLLGSMQSPLSDVGNNAGINYG